MGILLGGLILTGIVLLFGYFLHSNNDGDSSIPFATYGSYPIIGHFISFVRDRTKLLLECRQRYGPCFRIKVFNQRFTMILSYADWMNVLRNPSLELPSVETGIKLLGLSPLLLIATKPGAGRPQKVTNREKRLIKLQQLRNDTASLADLVRYANTNLNLSISPATLSRILRSYNMISYIAPRKPQITPTQRRNRIQWCYDHLNWSVNDRSNVIFSDESNYEVVNRKNRIYIRRFRNDRTRFQRSQKRVHKGGGIVYV